MKRRRRRKGEKEGEEGKEDEVTTNLRNVIITVLAVHTALTSRDPFPNFPF